MWWSLKTSGMNRLRVNMSVDVRELSSSQTSCSLSFLGVSLLAVRPTCPCAILKPLSDLQGRKSRS